jgi:hypothetical protein
MERRSFLGTLAASIAAVFVPKEAKAEIKDEFPYKNYLIGISAPVEKIPKLNTEDKSWFLIEDGFIELYTNKGIFSGDYIRTDVFGEILFVSEVRDAVIAKSTDGRVNTEDGRICTLYTLKTRKICNAPIITMINGKIKLLKKKDNFIKGDFLVIGSAFRESSN